MANSTRVRLPKVRVSQYKTNRYAYMNSDDYKVLNSDGIMECVADMVQEVSSIVELNSTVTRILLSHCKWDQTVLLEKFYTDIDKLCKEARVVQTPIVASINDSIATSQYEECEKCGNEVLSSWIIANACGHRLCRYCWSEHFQKIIRDKNFGNSVECIAHNCDVIIDDKLVIKLVDDLQAKEKYQLCIANSFVQHNELFRWCPGPGCSLAVKILSRSWKPIRCTCECGHEFCFDCGEKWHWPVPCEVLKRFEAHLKNAVFHNCINLWTENFRARIELEARLRKREQLALPSVQEISINVEMSCPNCKEDIGIIIMNGDIMNCLNCSSYFCCVCLDIGKDFMHNHNCKGKQISEDFKELEEEDLIDEDRCPNCKEDINIIKKGNIMQCLNCTLYFCCLCLVVKQDSMHNHNCEDKQISEDFEELEEEDVMKRDNIVNPDDIPMSEKTTESIKRNNDGVSPSNSANSVSSLTEMEPIRKSFRKWSRVPEKSATFNRREFNGGEAIDEEITERERSTTFDQHNKCKTPNPQSDADQEMQEEYGFGKNAVDYSVTYEEIEMEFVRPKNKDINYFNKFNAENVNSKVALSRYAQIKQQMVHYDLKSLKLEQFEWPCIFLAKCRQTLAYSAIFAMYLKVVDQSSVFNFLHKNLYDATVKLSSSIANVNIHEPQTHELIPETIMPAYEICHRCYAALRHFIDEGYENDSWTFEEQPNLTYVTSDFEFERKITL